VERHPALHGAYWKSYDFLPDGERDDLVLFPLGPVTLKKDHPFEKQAFRHDGGEIIFNLPNGLQGYLLVNGKDERIDAGPIKVVGDAKKTSGTFEIVNGLSCMACHQHCMIRGFRDMVRGGSPAGGRVRDKLRQLYPPAERMEALLQEDEERFLRALDGAMGPFLKVGDDRDRDVRDFPEPVSALARWYLLQELTLEDAAVELGLRDAKRLQAAIENNPRLAELGLGPLVRGATIKRERWESLKFFLSPYQETARALELGTPKRYQ
jgi:serine/threonine-protein kinase